MKKNLCLCFFHLFLTMIFFVPSAAFAQDVNDMSAEELTAYIISLARILEEKQSETSSVVVNSSASDNCSIVFNNKTYAGTYIGDTKNSIPHGEGRFEGAFNNKKLIYEGTWQDGQFAGRGNLECEEYTLHFDNSEGVFDRIGPFNGKVINGIPNGRGTFSSVNSEGVSWTYTGEWSNGSFHGQGKSIWDDDSATSQVGTYIKGSFAPTLSEAIAILSNNSNFSLSENSKSFLDNHHNLFYKEHSNPIGNWKPSFADDGSILPSTGKMATHKTVSIPSHLIHTFFHIREFKKKPSLYDQKLLHITNAHVIQVVSFEFGISTFEGILFETSDGIIYQGFLQGSSSIVEDMQIEAYVLPFDYSTYEDVSSGETWAIFCAVASNIQETYDTLQTGSTGNDVLKMKYRMQELGYFNADASLSDSYNNTCVERVKQFQAANHLPVTGIADHATLSLLYSNQAIRKP